MSWRGRLGAGAGLAIVAAATAVAWRPVSDWQAERRAAEALSAASVCLLGEAPGEETEANRRLRRVAIAASLDRVAGASWPSRCEPYVDGLRGALADLAQRHKRACAEAPCDPQRLSLLGQLREEAAHAAELSERGHSALFDADRLLALSRAIGLPAVAAPSWAAAAPAPAALIDPRQMTPLYVGDYLRVLTDPAGDDTLDLLFYEQEARYALCGVALADATARCRNLSEAIPVGLAGELLAGEPGAPARIYAQGFEGNQWTHALFDVQSGRRVATVRDRPAGGFVWRDGTLARVGFEPSLSTLALIRQRGESGEGEAVPVEPGGEPSFGPRLVWDELVWALPADAGRHRLFARRAQSGGEPLGPLHELGETLPVGRAPEFDVCRSDRALTLMFGHRERDSALVTLFVRGDRGWHEPIHVKVGAGIFGLTCRGEGATLSWVRAIHEEPAPDDWSPSLPEAATTRSDGDRAPVRGRYAVHRMRCNADGCQHARSVVSLHRYALNSRYVAGDLGDATVVLWRSALGDIRMRLAPLQALPEAPEVTLFDDVEHDGFGWDLERDPIIGRGDAVLLLLSQQVGTSDASATYGLRIRADGTVTPVARAGGDDGMYPSAAL